MAPEMEVNTDSPLAGLALRNGLLATDGSMEAELHSLSERLNRFRIENEQLEKLILEKDAEMKAKFTCQVYMEIKVATFKREKGILTKYNSELLSFARCKGAKSTCTGEGSIETIHPMFLGLAFHVQKAIVLYCCKEIFELVLLISQPRRGWRMRGKDVQELRFSRGFGNLFASSNPF